MWKLTLSVKKMTKCDKIRLSKCIQHLDSKCVKIDAICANLILTLFVRNGYSIAAPTIKFYLQYLFIFYTRSYCIILIQGLILSYIGWRDLTRGNPCCLSCFFRYTIVHERDPRIAWVCCGYYLSHRVFVSILGICFVYIYSGFFREASLQCDHMIPLVGDLVELIDVFTIYMTVVIHAVVGYNWLWVTYLNRFCTNSD